MHASSSVSACDAGHPRQCIPASNKMSAFSGAFSNNSPIFVSLLNSIFLFLSQEVHMSLFVSSCPFLSYLYYFIIFFQKSIDKFKIILYNAKCWNE